LDDSWLDDIQQPARVERLLEAFARDSGLLPSGARRIRKQKALPEQLQKIVRRAIAHVWVAFSKGSRYWLITGAVSVALSQLRQAPVLHANSYTEDGALIDAGPWSLQRDARWCREDS